jgi:hypothetical protein
LGLVQACLVKEWTQVFNQGAGRPFKVDNQRREETTHHHPKRATVECTKRMNLPVLGTEINDIADLDAKYLVNIQTQNQSNTDKNLNLDPPNTWMSRLTRPTGRLWSFFFKLSGYHVVSE